MLVYVNEGFSVWTLEVTWKCGILGVIAFSMWVEIYSGDKSDIENKTGSVMGGGVGGEIFFMIYIFFHFGTARD